MNNHNSSFCLLAQKALKHRRVKHYGFEFRYDNNNVDKDKPLPAGQLYTIFFSYDYYFLAHIFMNLSVTPITTVYSLIAVLEYSDSVCSAVLF